MYLAIMREAFLESVVIDGLKNEKRKFYDLL
jgi:hypothetical protein